MTGCTEFGSKFQCFGIAIKNAREPSMVLVTTTVIYVTTYLDT